MPFLQAAPPAHAAIAPPPHAPSFGPPPVAQPLPAQPLPAQPLPAQPLPAQPLPAQPPAQPLPWTPVATPFPPPASSPGERTRATTAEAPQKIAPQAPYARVSGTPFSAPAPSAIPAPRHDSSAAFGGIAAASDAAVHVHARPAAEQVKAAPIQRAPSNEYLDVVWFDPASPERIREQASWTDLLRDPPKANDWVTGDEADRSADRGRGERDVRRALSRVAPIAPDAIHLLVTEAIDEDGVLVRPLCVIGGDLLLAFDPVESLRAMITAASHFTGGDKKLKDVVDAAAEAVGEDKRIASTLVETLASRIRQTFASAPRGVAHDYLDTTTERLLLDERKYARRNVLGGPHIYAELYGEAGPPMPTYLDASLADRLPLFRRFRVRLLAEPHPPQDPTDAGYVALRALALSRVVPRRRGP
ncbi:MAG: hypothetical protein JNL21_04995 [Myxococcales bacterium]|nr:hypothetical protein [Myxococcales bacterium]